MGSAWSRSRTWVVDAALDGIATEPAACAGREQRIFGCAASLCDPDREDGLCLFCERDGPVFASFAFDPHAAAGAEGDVAAVDGDEFRDS